jgi:hypothetical protein
MWQPRSAPCTAPCTAPHHGLEVRDVNVDGFPRGHARDSDGEHLRVRGQRRRGGPLDYLVIISVMFAEGASNNVIMRTFDCTHSQGVSLDRLHGPSYRLSSVEPCFDEQ